MHINLKCTLHYQVIPVKCRDKIHVSLNCHRHMGTYVRFHKIFEHYMSFALLTAIILKRHKTRQQI